MGKRKGSRSLLYRLFFKVPPDDAYSSGRASKNDPKHTFNGSNPRPEYYGQQPKPPESPGKWIKLLIISNGNETVREMTRFPFVIGREQPEHGLRIDDKSVSRRHAAFSILNDRIAINDENSSNGVEVSGEKLFRGESRALIRGDIIKVGHAEITVIDLSGAAEVADDGAATEFIGYKKIPGAETGPSSESVSKHEPAAEPTFEPAYTPESAAGQETASEAESEPATVPKPDSVPEPGPVAVPEPKPAPKLASTPEPEPEPEPEPAPKPKSAPTTAPEPESAPAIEPVPVSIPEPKPEPVSAPVPTSEPAPAPTSFCTKCGHKNLRSDKFCVKCGAKAV